MERTTCKRHLQYGHKFRLDSMPGYVYAYFGVADCGCCIEAVIAESKRGPFEIGVSIRLSAYGNMYRVEP